MTYIKRVTLTVETDGGESFTIHEDEPGGPGDRGDNPRFMGRQLDAAMSDLEARAQMMVRADHGRQTDDPSTPADALRAIGESARRMAASPLARA